MAYLQTLFYWILTLAVIIPPGYFTLNLITKKGAKSLSFGLTAITGMAVVSLVAAIIQLFIPLGTVVTGVLAAAALLTAFLLRKGFTGQVAAWVTSIKSYPPVILGAMGVLFMLVLYLCNLPGYNHDNGLYYIPTIHYLSNYSIITGLGNLHSRLAFGSFWHVLAAVFAQAKHTAQLHNSSLTGLMLLAASCYFVEPLKRNNPGKAGRHSVLRASGILLGFLLYKALSVPAADLPVALLIFLLVILFAEDAGGNFLVIVLLTAWLVTIKLSAAVLVLLPVVVIIMHKESRTQILPALAIAIAFASVFIARSYILSGYFIYPSVTTGFLRPDWQMPVSLLVEESKAVTAWARMPLTHPMEAADYSITQWLPEWRKTLRATNLLLTLATLAFAIATPLVFGLGVLRRKHHTKAGLIWLWLVLLLAVGLWFYKMPAFRMGYGSILAFCMLSFIIITPERILAFVKPELLFALGLVLLSLQIPEARKAPANPVIQYEAQTTPLGKTYYVPKGDDRCFAGGQPCANRVNPCLEFRGGAVANGFKSTCK